MNMLKKLVCGVCAAVMCFAEMGMYAGADDLDISSFYIGGYYVINTSRVYSCMDKFYVAGYHDEWSGDYLFSVGDVVYADYGAYSTQGRTEGLTFASCSSEPGGSWYGWVDMRYLTPYDEYYAPEPETEPPTEKATTTTTTTTTTTATTTKATTTKKTTTTTTMTTTTTTEMQTTTTEKVPAAVHKSSGGFFKNNIILLMIGAIVALLAVSASLAVFLIFKSKKEQKTENVQPQNNASSQSNSSVKICPKCGEQHSSNMVYCRKCGTKL